MDWDELYVFLTVAQSKSFGKASENLGVSYTTVSRKIDQLEKSLGTPLFLRTHGELSLTIEGQQALSAARKVSKITKRLEREIQSTNTKVEGRIVVTLAKAVLCNLLLPYLPAFKQKHPGLSIEFDTSREFLDVMKGEADVAIRLTDNHEYKVPETLIGLRLPDIYVHAYANKKVASNLIKEGELKGLGWINWDRRINFQKMQQHFDQENLPITWCLDDITAQVEFIKDGLGIGILPCFLGDAEKSLERIFKEAPSLLALDAWVVAHPDMKNVEKIRAFMHFVADCFKAEKKLISGSHV